MQARRHRTGGESAHPESAIEPLPAQTKAPAAENHAARADLTWNGNEAFHARPAAAVQTVSKHLKESHGVSVSFRRAGGSHSIDGADMANIENMSRFIVLPGRKYGLLLKGACDPATLEKVADVMSALMSDQKTLNEHTGLQEYVKSIDSLFTAQCKVFRPSVYAGGEGLGQRQEGALSLLAGFMAKRYGLTLTLRREDGGEEVPAARAASLRIHAGENMLIGLSGPYPEDKLLEAVGQVGGIIREPGLLDALHFGVVEPFKHLGRGDPGRLEDWVGHYSGKEEASDGMQALDARLKRMRRILQG